MCKKERKKNMILNQSETQIFVGFANTEKHLRGNNLREIDYHLRIKKYIYEGEIEKSGLQIMFERRSDLFTLAEITFNCSRMKVCR